MPGWPRVDRPPQAPGAPVRPVPPPAPPRAPSLVASPQARPWTGAAPAHVHSNPWRTWWPYAILAIPISSLLGLLIVILNVGLGTVGAWWSANLWGDLVFAAGTFGAFWLSSTLASAEGRPTGVRFAIAVVVGFVAHYAVYLLAASLSFESSGFLSVHLATSSATEGLGERAINLLRYGLAGIVGMAFAGALVGLFLPRASSTSSAPAATGAK